jgi:hypothetical protein
MPYLFFVLISIFPGLIGYMSGFVMQMPVLYPFLVFVTSGYVFRMRNYGRAAVVSVWSFERSSPIAYSAALSGIAGILIFNGSIMWGCIVGIISFGLALFSLEDGPAYGWDSKG